MENRNLPNAIFKPKRWLAGFISIALYSVLMASTTYAAKKAQESTSAPAEVNVSLPQKSVDGICSGSLSNPSAMTLPIGKSTLINLPEPIASRTVGNQEILQAKLITPQTLYVLGLDLGATNMIIQGKSGHCVIMDVTVNIDPNALQNSLNELLPDEKNIKVSALSDSVVLTGTVENALSASYAVDIASAYVRRFVNPVPTGTNNTQNQNQNQNQQNNILTSTNTGVVNPRVVNMLSVSAQQQVMLEVKIAEVSKTLLDQLGAQGALGGDKFKLLTPFFSTPGAIFGLAATAPAQFVSSLGTETLVGGTPAVRAQGPQIGRTNGKGIAVDGQKQDSLVKILAEPTVMAISGQEGSFLAGGKIFIPVAQNNNGGAATITLEEKEFGVGVKFTPTVLAGGRINLRVAPEVSELNPDGVGISANGVTGTAILPSFTTRKAATTVQLLDGQSFAIGGLIKNNTTTNIKAFPILGELPVIGALFRSTEFQKDKTELVFIVTPHLVKPLASKEVRLPTDRYQDPSRAELHLQGKLEGKLPADAPPPVPAPQNEVIPPKDAKEQSGGFDIK